MVRKLLNLTGILTACCISAAGAQDFQWVKTWGNENAESIGGTTIVRDNQGNLIATARFKGTVDFDPGAVVVNAASANNSFDGAISKFDQHGNFLWVKTFATANDDQGFKTIDVDSADNIYAAGVFYFDNTGLNTIVAKYSTTGNLLWADTFINAVTGAQNIVNSLTADDEGNTYVTGSYKGSVDFNPGVGTNVLSAAAGVVNNIFVLKLNAQGGLVWVKDFGNKQSFDGAGNKVAIDPSGKVYVFGYFGVSNSIPGTDSVNFSTGTDYLTTLGGTDHFILKLDHSGNYIWAKNYGSKKNDTRAVSLAFDDGHHVILSGSFADTTDFDPGPASFQLLSQQSTSAAYTNDIFLSKLDSSGNFIWAKNIVSSMGVLNLNYDIKTDVYGNIYAVGGFMGAADFDPDTSSYVITANGNSQYFYLSKYNNDGQLRWAEKFDSLNTSGNQGSQIAIGSGGDIYVCGVFASTVDFDFSSNSYPDTSNGGTDVFLLKINDCTPFGANNPVLLSGPDSVCPGGTYTYAVYTMYGNSYTWTLPNGWTGSSNGNTITVTAGDNEGTISVIANGACDTSTAQSLNVSFKLQPVHITVNELTLGTGSNDYTTWQWLRNDTAIAGATNATYNVTENGEYCVAVTKDGCTDTACYTVTNVHIDDVESIARYISVHPNPSDGRIYISSPVAVNATLSDIEGRVHREMENVNQMDIKNLAQGMYLLRISDKAGRLIKAERIIKQ